jgi:hypothetical protein
MSISSRQATKATSRIIEDRMKEGYIPTIDFVLAKLGEFYSKYSLGYPFFKDRQQPYRKLFNVDDYNSNLEEIYDDLNNLYEELVEQFTVVLIDFDYFDTERRKVMSQIKSLDSQLIDLVLVAQDTEGYVYSVHDSFNDRSYVDLRYSTCEINTDAGVATLRESRSGITKIDMSHYFDTVNFPILAEAKFAQYVISNTLFPLSKFGYAFSDMSASWIQNIITSKAGELQVSFIVNLSPNDTNGQTVTRIEVRGQAAKDMSIQPLYSIDNINFIALPVGYGDRVKQVLDDKVTVWNFDELHIRYVKFIVYKSVEDEQISYNDTPAYRYTIGFKHIEFFKMGYDQTSILYSTGHTIIDPAGESLTIDKASLIVDQDTQAGTSVEYYLSLGSEVTDDPNQYNWAVVSPANIPNPAEQQVVDFKHVAFFNNVPEILWDSATFGTPVETYQGISFYKIYKFASEPIKNSITLFRGKDNWIVTPTYDVKRIAIFDEKHTFGAVDTTTLTYPNFTPVAGNGLIRGSVKVKSEPGQNPAYYAATPGDFSVNYSTKVVTKTPTGVISPDTTSPHNTVYIDYQYDSEIALPTIYTTYVYVLNQDGVSVNHIPFNQAELDAGQYTMVQMGDVDLNVSAASLIKLSPGWHRIMTTAEPESPNDRFYSANGNKYLYQLVYKQFAYVDKLQEISWFDLKYNTRKSDHSKYALIDYEGDGNKKIIVNYRPQTAKWASAVDDLLCAHGAETYVLSYKFITTATNRIYLKAIFSRNEDTAATATSTLRSYTVKLGY